MSRYLKICFSVFLMGWLWSLPAAANVLPGQKAPDFTISDTHGKTYSLSAEKGKFVVLEWFNYDCPFIRKHYNSGNMQALQKKYTAKGVLWFSINSSAPGKQGNYPPEAINRMAKERGTASTAIFLDPDGRIGKMYGAKTTPHMFVINPKGVLVYEGALDSIASTDVADVSRADNYVADALDAAMAGRAVAVAMTKSYGCSVKY